MNHTLKALVVLVALQYLSAPAMALDCAIGFFYFKDHQRLRTPSLQNAYVRTAIEWRQYEPRPGTFVIGKDNKEDEAINSLLSSGNRVIPSIRAKSSWAVEPTPGKAATPPRDLDRLKPLRLMLI